MRFLFKTDYEDDIRLFPHSGYFVSYAVLLALLMVATSVDPNRLRICALCGVPLVAAMVKPRDSKAPISTVPLTIRLKPR